MHRQATALQDSSGAAPSFGPSTAGTSALGHPTSGRFVFRPHLAKKPIESVRYIIHVPYAHEYVGTYFTNETEPPKHLQRSGRAIYTTFPYDNVA